MTPEQKERAELQRLETEAEARLQARLTEIEQAETDGRLGELIEGVPPVREQLRHHLNGS